MYTAPSCLQRLAKEGRHTYNYDCLKEIAEYTFKLQPFFKGKGEGPKIIVYSMEHLGRDMGEVRLRIKQAREKLSVARY